MQIPSLIASISRQLICCSLCIFILCFLIIKLIAFLTGYHLLGVVLIVYGFYRLLKEVGIFALYPGCFRFIKSDYQLKGSQRLVQIIVKNNQELVGIFQKCQNYPDTAYLVPNHYPQYVESMIKLLTKFQPTLTPTKQHLLTTYHKISNILQKQTTLAQHTLTFTQFLQNPNEYKQNLNKKYGNSQHLKLFSAQIRTQLSPLMIQLNTILHQFHPPRDAGAFKLMMYRLYSQKLYQIRFGYMYWDNRFQYSIHMVENQSQAVIQCTVLKPKNTLIPLTNKCVIISLPNGAYLQYFALQSQYIDMYFKLGYQIILWNYRGYGQSTGTPSISSSIADAQAVYNYCKFILKLNPEIAHGYSIGGPPAAVLALTNQMKVVVIDRSFCNFVNIAHEISPILAKLARIVMKSDSNVKISEVFLRIRNCRKILIWSAVDEVISNGSSLKLGILNKMYKEAQVRQQHDFQPNSPTALIQQNQLHEREGFIDKGDNVVSRQRLRESKKEGKNRVQNWLDVFMSFFQTVSTLYQAQKIQTFTKQSPISNNSLAQQIPIQTQLMNIPSQRRQQSKQLIDKFWQIIQHLDGGGTTTSFLKELAKGGIDKHDEMCLEVRSFVLGLIYYGCCYHQNGGLNVDNFDNWPETINVLGKVQQDLSVFISENQNQRAPKIVEYFKQVNRAFKQIRIYLQKINKNKDRQLGIILPTDSGHNGELTTIQIKYLQTAISIQNESDRKNRNQMMMQK